MKFILLIFCLMCSNASIAQKKDTFLTLYKENIELKKQLTDVEKTIIRVETEYKALEKIQTNWLIAIGIISTLIILAVGFTAWNSYNVAKAAGEKASADIEAEFNAMKIEIKNSQEKLLNLNNEAELMLQKARGIVNSLATTSEMPNQPPNNT